MNRSAKRMIVACLLTAAMGLMICPPWHGRGHRLLWNGRGTLDWSRLALELCLVASIGALAAVVAPMVGRPSTRALKIWFRRAGLVLGCAAVLTLATTAGYDVIVRIVLLRDYSQEVRGFQAKEQLLQQAFPIEPPVPTIPVAEMEVARQQQPIIASQIQWDESISNVHEAEIILRSLGCDDRSIQRATTRFLSASTPEYSNKTLMFEIGTTGEKHGDCPPKEDIFDQVAANAAPPSQAPPPPPGFTVDPSELQFVPEYREIGFDFRIEDSDAAKRFFAPLPDWHSEALQHKIEVSRVPDWMKPGEPPAEWSLGEWLESRSSWLIPAAALLALSALCFVVASRIDRTRPIAKSGVGGVRV